MKPYRSPNAHPNRYLPRPIRRVRALEVRRLAGDGMTQTAIGVQFGIDRSRVKDILTAIERNPDYPKS